MRGRSARHGKSSIARIRGVVALLPARCSSLTYIKIIRCACASETLGEESFRSCSWSRRTIRGVRSHVSARMSTSSFAGFSPATETAKTVSPAIGFCAWLLFNHQSANYACSNRPLTFELPLDPFGPLDGSVLSGMRRSWPRMMLSCSMTLSTPAMVMAKSPLSRR